MSNAKTGVLTGVKGAERLPMLRIHRLAEFERVFSLYIDGKVPASLVTDRAKKMLEVGLPRLM